MERLISTVKSSVPETVLHRLERLLSRPLVWCAVSVLLWALILVPVFARDSSSIVTRVVTVIHDGADTHRTR